MHRNYHFFATRVFSGQKTTMFENSDLYRMNWRKRYFDAFLCYRTRYTFIWRAGEHSYKKLYVIFQQCEIMGSCLLNFLLVRVKLLIWWDFCRFF